MPFVCFSSDEKYDGDEYIETITADGESEDKSTMNQPIVCINTDGTEYSHQIEVDEYTEEQDLEEDGIDSTQYERFTLNNSNIKGENSSSVYYISGTTTKSSVNNDTHHIQSPPRQSKVLTHTQTAAVSSQHNADPDERFLLSCLPNLKRLPTKKNALARLKIQQILYEIEFDDYSEVGGQ